MDENAKFSKQLSIRYIKENCFKKVAGILAAANFPGQPAKGASVPIRALILNRY
jgi:hypothetical protein